MEESHCRTTRPQLRRTAASNENEQGEQEDEMHVWEVTPMDEQGMGDDEVL